MEKYEVAVDARMINASGIGTYLQNILPAICKTYKTVLLGDRSELSAYGADIIDYYAPIYSVKEVATLPFIVPACKVFWSPHFNVPLLAIRAKHAVTTIHDIFHLAFYHTLDRKQQLYASLFYNLAAKRSKKVITVSDFSKQEIIKYTAAKANKIKVIYNGVHQKEFAGSVSQDNAALIAKRYSLPPHYLLFVGNVKPHKNLLNLASALEDVFERCKDLSLVIVGKKEGFITGDNQVANLIETTPLLKERILFTGFVEQQDLPLIYQKAILFVMPSIYEGFGLPPLEAMAAKTLTAVSNQASLPEICKEGTMYFNPFDKEDIKNVINKGLNLTAKEEEALKLKGLKISRMYTWEKSRQEHISLFHELVS